MLDESNLLTLPDDTEVFYLNKDETLILYKQVKEYLNYGISLKKGDVVFDVGANIGLFTIWLNNYFNNELTIHAFELIPDIHRILKLNIDKLKSETIFFHNYGLSDSLEVTECGYFPNATALSSLYPDSSKEEKSLIKSTFLNGLKSILPDSSIFFKILKRMPRFLVSILLDSTIEKAFIVEGRSCQLKTISNVICEHKINSIDLLKIDVEKSELNVINGINDSDWHKIRQTVIEVHDIDDRVSTLTNILKMKGFRQVNVIQEPDLEGTNIYCIYALR